jgi:plastocyanin
MRRTPLTVAGAAVALAITLAACGGDDGDTGSTPTSSESGGSSIVVKARDQLKFDKDAYEAEAGTVDVTYQNTGSVAHTLLIKGKSGFKLAVGSTDEGSIDLDPGTYTLYCDIAGHEAAGMKAELTVK